MEASGLGGAMLELALVPSLLAGVSVALIIRYLPGKGGHSPGDGFKVGRRPSRADRAARRGARGVCDPESGRGARTRSAPDRPRRRPWRPGVRLVKRDAPARTGTVVAAAGSFAAVSTLLGSPLRPHGSSALLRSVPRRRPWHGLVAHSRDLAGVIHGGRNA